MSLEKLVWGGELTQPFDVEINGKTHNIVLRTLTTEDSLAMDLNIMSEDKPDTKMILADAIEMLSRAIVSIDGNIPDGVEETKAFLLKRTQTGDVFRILDKFQSLGSVVQEEAKN